MTMSHQNTDETMAKQATVRKSQALGWASKAGATTQAEAQQIYNSYQEMKKAAQSALSPQENTKQK
jgi:hypothetical protein